MEIDKPRSPIKKALAPSWGSTSQTGEFNFCIAGAKYKNGISSTICRIVMQISPPSSLAWLCGARPPAPVEQGGDEKCDGFP
jgi:hypothetical protein